MTERNGVANLDSWVDDWWLTFKNLIWPQFCRDCGVRLLTEENGYFCPTCWEQSPRIMPPLCPKCGRPHESAIGFGPVVSYICEECNGESSRTIRYDRVCGAATYQDAIARAIRLFKFNGKVRLAEPLAELMREAAERDLDTERYTHIIPVPLYPVRGRERGFNQSRLLADCVLPTFPNATIDESLRRVRPTRTQSRLASEAERKANVRGAFDVIDGAQLKGATVLLIDDVVTSRGTANECARVLRQAGVERVDVLAVALAIHTRQMTQNTGPYDAERFRGIG